MWLRLEPNIFRHQKFLGLAVPVRFFHVEGMLFCSEFSTDGRVPRSFVAGKRKQGFADALTTARVWHEAKHLRTTCADCWAMVDSKPGDGWVIHDFLKYNPSKDELERRRAYDRARKAPHGVRGDSEGIPRADRPSVQTEQTGDDPTETRRREIEAMMT